MIPVLWETLPAALTAGDVSVCAVREKQRDWGAAVAASLAGAFPLVR